MTAPQRGRDRPIRILRVIARMNVGGPALQVTAMVTQMDPERFETRLLTGTPEDGEGDYLALRASHVDARYVDGLGRSPKPLDDVRAFRSIVREVRDYQPDIVHTHTAKAGVLGRIAARMAGVPIVVHTFHGHVLHGYFSEPVTRVIALTERALAKRSTALVSVGSRVRDELLEAGIGRREQYRVIAPGVDLPEAIPKEDARTEFGLPQDVPVVGFVGRLTQIKRPDRFVEMARAVGTSRPNVVFAVLGEGDLLEETRSRARDLGDRIRFLGWRSEVQNFYRACDVLVLTSDNEGMPVTLIEAAHVGTPAVTTDVGSASEVVVDGETGTVTIRDAGRLAEAVTALLDAPAGRERMGAAAEVRASELFTTQRLVADTERLYEDLLAGLQADVRS